MRFRSGRRDDLGRLLQSLATMQASLMARATEQAEARGRKGANALRAGTIAAGCHRKPRRGVRGKVGKLVLNIESAATQLEATANSMSSTAEQTNQQAAIVADNAEQATTNVDAVSGATAQLVASAHEIFALVRNSTELICQAVEGARQADETVVLLADGAKKNRRYRQDDK